MIWYLVNRFPFEKYYSKFFRKKIQIFIQTALNNTKMSDNLNYDYDELNDSNPTSILPSKHNNKNIYFNGF